MLMDSQLGSLDIVFRVSDQYIQQFSEYLHLHAPMWHYGDPKQNSLPSPFGWFLSWIFLLQHLGVLNFAFT